MFEDHQRIHIAGLGPHVAGLARILDQRGFEVTRDGDGTAEVESADIVVSDVARGRDGPRPSGIEVVDAAGVVEQLVGEFRSIAVTGTHGTGTVSSMIAWILECAGRQPGFLFSTVAHNFDAAGRDGKGKWFVLELDERQASHYRIHCDYVVCNFLELTPPAYYEQIGDVVAAMRQFLESNRRRKEVFANLDCMGNRELIRDAALRPTGYALDHRAEFHGEVDSREPQIRFRADHREVDIGVFSLDIPGDYNAVNALGAVAVAHRLGVDSDVIARALASYDGMKNRYTVARGGGVNLVKERISHPTAVARVVESAAQGVDGRYTGVVELSDVHGDSSLRRRWAEAFAPCDEVVSFAPADQRENGADAVDDEFRKTTGELTLVDREEQLVERLVDTASPGDKLIFVGGDQFLRMADHVQAELAADAAKSPPKGEQPRLDGPLAEGDE